MPDMLIPPIFNNPSKVQLARLSHIYFEHPDLARFAAFAKDFGFVEAKRSGDTVYFHGYGKDPYLATVRTLDEAPGGGKMITFHHPNDTFMHVVYGQVERVVDTKHIPSGTHESQGPYNKPFEKPRSGQFQRHHDGPGLAHKLGHFGYVCKEFDTELEFYTCNFNFVPSDVLFHLEIHNVDVFTFMHLDLGE